MEEMQNVREDAVDHPAKDEEVPFSSEVPFEEEQRNEERSEDAETPAESVEVLPDYAQMARDDLAEIKRLDRAYASVSHLGELPFAKRFAQLRDMGLSVAEALAASVPRFEKRDSRSHLRAVLNKGSYMPNDTLDREGLKEARVLFDGLSDAQIHALYRRVTRKNND